MSNHDIVVRAIADTTRNLMSEKAVEQITVNEICECSGVNHRTFYRYFTDKHAVVEHIYSQDSLTRGLADSSWSFWDYWPYIAKTLYHDRRFYCHVLQYHGQNSFRQYSISLLRPILARDYRAAFPDEISLNFFIDHVCNMAFDSFVIWLSMDPCPSPEAFAEYFCSCFASFSRVNLQLLERQAEP